MVSYRVKLANFVCSLTPTYLCTVILLGLSPYTAAPSPASMLSLNSEWSQIACYIQVERNKNID